MQDRSRKNIYEVLCCIIFFVLLIINIRVAAGIASTFERAVDGLVGVGILLIAIYVALDFFQLIGGPEQK